MMRAEAGFGTMIFRAACDKVASEIGNAMDFERIRAPGVPGSPFAEVFLAAANKLAEAEGLLYKHDWKIVCWIVGEGKWPSEVAVIIAGPNPPERLVKACGQRLRIYSFRDFDSMAMRLTGEPIVRGRKVWHRHIVVVDLPRSG
jgi:hypothetical protein